jgi:hypothetical protein
MTASKRSLNWVGDSADGRAAGGAGRADWATTESARLSRRVPATPPPNAQLPNKTVVTNRFIGGALTRVKVVATGRVGRRPLQL